MPAHSFPDMSGPMAGCSPALRASLVTGVAALSLLALGGFAGAFARAIVLCAEVLAPVTAVFALAAGCSVVAAACCWRRALSSGPRAADRAGEAGVPLTEDGEEDAPPSAAASGSSRCACVAKHGIMTACGIAVIALWVCAILAVWISGSTQPTLSGELRLPGLAAPVTVFHDKSTGVVHIDASGELSDGFFALGVAHAQLRFWQMHFQRSVGAGRLSEAVGEQGLTIDRLMRTLGVYRAAERAAAAMPPDAALALDRYADGVNAYLGTSPPVPFEFKLLGLGKPEPWRRADSIVWAKLMSYNLGGNMASEMKRFQLHTARNLTAERIAELMPAFDDAHFPIALSPADVGTGSAVFGCDYNYSASPLGAGARRDDAAVRDAGGDAVARALRRATALFRSASASASASASVEAERAAPPAAPAGRGLSWLFPNGVGDASFRPPWELGRHGASNNWVVGGSRTTTGKPLLCNDPHLTLMAPSIWLVVSIKAKRVGAMATLNPYAPAGRAEEPVEMVGATFPALPGIVLGRNDRIAWGVTNTGADVQDLFVMQPPPDGSDPDDFYAWKGGKEAYVTRSETIKVAHAADVTIRVRESRFGAVVTDNGNFPEVQPPSGPRVDMSLRWISTDSSVNDTTMASFLRIGIATDHAEWTDALRDFVAPSQNMVFAGTDGSIAYRMTGRVPVRAGNRTGMWPVAGDGVGDDWDWVGWVPFSGMPATLNPPEGFIVTANNRIVPPGFPHFITGDWDSGSNGYRAKRITDLVCQGSAGNARLSPLDMRRIQLDTVSYVGRDLAAAVGDSLPDSALTGAARAGKAALAGWDHNASVGSTQQTTSVRLMAAVGRLAAPETGTAVWKDVVFTIRAMRGGDPACAAADGDATCRTFFAAALNNASADDGQPAAWGVPGRHMATFKHQVLGQSPLSCLADRTVAHGGDFSTINVGSGALDDKEFPQTAGPSYREIVDLSDPDSSVFLNPLGQDGNIFSPQYDSLLDAWADGDYLPMRAKASGGAVSQSLVPDSKQ